MKNKKLISAVTASVICLLTAMPSMAQDKPFNSVSAEETAAALSAGVAGVVAGPKRDIRPLTALAASPLTAISAGEMAASIASAAMTAIQEVENDNSAVLKEKLIKAALIKDKEALDAIYEKVKTKADKKQIIYDALKDALDSAKTYDESDYRDTAAEDFSYLYDYVMPKEIKLEPQQKTEFLETAIVKYPQDTMLVDKVLFYLEKDEVTEYFDSSVLLEKTDEADMEIPAEKIIEKLGPNKADKLKTKFDPARPAEKLQTAKDGVTLLAYWAIKCTDKQDAKLDKFAKLLLDKGADKDAVVPETYKTVKQIVKENDPSDEAKEIFEIEE